MAGQETGNQLPSGAGIECLLDETGRFAIVKMTQDYQTSLWYRGESRWGQAYLPLKAQELALSRIVAGKLLVSGKRVFCLFFDAAGPLPNAPYLRLSAREMRCGAESLRVFPGGRYWTDGHQVFWDATALEGADPASFSPFPTDDRWISGKRYNVDLDELTPLSWYAFGRDKARMYCGPQVLKGVDPARAEILSPAFIRIGPSGAGGLATILQVPSGRPLADADPGSFRVLDERYSADRERVWSDGMLLAGASAPSFATLGRGWARDKASAWFEGWPIAGAEAAGFRLLGPFHAVDGKRVYYRGSPVEGADPATFRPYPLTPEVELALKGTGVFPYGRDGEHVFLGLAVLKGKDPRGFDPLKHMLAEWEKARAATEADFAQGKIRY